ELALPEGAVVAMVLRGGEMIPPAGVTEIRPGDHVSVVLRPEARPAVDRAFADGAGGHGDGNGDGERDTQISEGEGEAS
ncbi:MAG TPA: TrkA C-terminal domain-containing protein, partial [Longimicrobiaceae bacterium]